MTPFQRRRNGARTQHAKKHSSTSATKTLEKQDEDHQTRWDKVWADEISRKYKRRDHVDYWLWSDELYSAPIDDLQHIAAMVREV